MLRAIFGLVLALSCAIGGGASASAAPAAGPTATESPASTAATAASNAASSDPMQAPECRQALAALHEEEEAVAASARIGARDPHVIPPSLDAARRRAAHRCLASRADPPPSSRLAQPPFVVSPVADARPPLAALPSAPAAVAIPSKPPSPPPLTSITLCDASGCWASDGTRLNRLGPTLWGPRGACSVVGAVVHCP